MKEQASSPSRSRFPQLAGAAFFFCYLAWQATFAVSCFIFDYACDLTWTMYSGRSEFPTIFVVWRSGEETLLDKKEGIDGVGRVLGGKMDQARFVPPYLCEHFPEIDSVRLSFDMSGAEETVPCQR